VIARAPLIRIGPVAADGLGYRHGLTQFFGFWGINNAGINPAQDEQAAPGMMLFSYVCIYLLEQVVARDLLAW
jgi:hypothetical protein